MKTGSNNYKGLNTDTGYDSIKDFYIDALDIRITTDKGESLGSITNIKGNSKFFELPIESQTQGIPEVIGVTSIRNLIILLVTDDSESNGWIYELSYTDVEQQFVNLDLIYFDADLGFRKENPIEVVSRFESENTQRIYWTDYENSLRSINIKNPNIQNTPVGLIDTFPSIKYQLPKLINVLGGGNLEAGLYQYAFRLITEDGKETLISPPSNLIHCVSSSESVRSADYTGDLEGTFTNKSHEIEIDISEYQSFDSIEFFVIFQKSEITTPEVFSIKTIELPDSNTVTFIHTGNEGGKTPIELFEFTNKQYPFKTVKSLAIKDNALIAANIKEGQFSIQDMLGPNESFDAKTKRFDRNGNEDNSLNSDLQKAFNINYNEDAHWDTDWHVNKQYKYQEDGQTLGGKGPNISYKYHLEPNIIDGDAQPGFVNLSNNPSSGVNLNDGHGNYANNAYDNTGSPFRSGVLKGYKRGETYRFGIVFYTKKGEVSFVEFIGDIKFPDLGDEDKEINSSGTNYFPIARETSRSLPIGITTTGYALGIEFDIDFSTCPSLLNQIESYQIVRAERTDSDTRRLCSGIFRVAETCNLEDSVPDNFNLRNNLGENDVTHLFRSVAAYTSDALSGGFISDLGLGMNGNFETIVPAYNNQKLVIGGGNIIRGDVCAFMSPEISYRFKQDTDIILNEESMLLITGRYGQYYSSLDINSTFYENNENIEIFNPESNSYSDRFSFDLRSDTTYSDLEGKFVDSVFKLRTTGKVDKETPYNGGTVSYNQYEKGVEYIRKFRSKIEKRFDLNTNNLDDIVEERNSNMGPLITGTGNLYLRNYYINRPKFVPENGPLIERNRLHRISPTVREIEDYIQSNFYKGTDSILASLQKIENDPLTGLPLNKHSLLDYFMAGEFFKDGNNSLLVSPKPDNIGPLNGTVEKELKTSTPLFDILLPKKEIYGGFNQNALENNVFIAASPMIHKQYTNPKVFGGDIFVAMFELQTGCIEVQNNIFDERSLIPFPEYFAYNFSETVNIPIESKINLPLSHGSTLSRQVQYTVQDNEGNNQERAVFRQSTSNSQTTHGKVFNMYKNAYNFAYSLENKSLQFFIKPTTLQEKSIKVNDIRAYKSNNKFNNEQIDSWTQFPTNDFYDVDDYGPINKILNFNDEIFFFQDRAVGRYAINTRVAVPAGDGIPLELGTGAGIQDHKYLSNTSGSIHQWGICKTQTGIYFWDDINSKINLVGAEGLMPLSEAKGIHALVNNFKGDVNLRKENGGDNPILEKGVHIVQDPINNEVLFTFLGISTENEEKNMTLVYDEMAQQFSSRYSATPTVYIENGNILLSSNPNNKKELYQHSVGNWGEFYESTTEASITLVLNADAPVNKILRTIEFNSIVRDDNKSIDRQQTITGFKIENEYQDTGKINFDSGRIKRKFDKWRLKIPRDQNTGNNRNRLRSSHFKLTLYFDNTYNKELILNRILYYYDIQIF